MLRKLTVAATMVAVVLVLPGVSDAGGLFLTEIGTNDVGLAGAGWAARAQDPATLFRNPAGMSLLEGNQALVGAQLLYVYLRFSNQGSSGFLGGNEGGNPVEFSPGLSAFYTHSLGQDVRLGFGVFSNTGLGLKYPGDWIGRYYAKESDLYTVSFMPAASYRINDWLSIGGALNIMVAELKYITAINQGAAADGQIRLQDVTAGIGGNVGMMLEPRKGTRVGVTYYSPVTLDFGSTPSYQNLQPGASNLLNTLGLVGNEIDLGLTIPQHVIVSGFHQLTDRLAIMGDFGWENWSQFGKVDVSVGPTSVTTNIPFDDTYHVGAGGQFRLNPKWLLNAGFAYDTSMVKDQDRSVALPVGASYKFGFGAEWQPSEKYTVGFNYEFAWSGDLPVTQTRQICGQGPLGLCLTSTVNGTYENVNVNFFAVNVKW